MLRTPGISIFKAPVALFVLSIHWWPTAAAQDFTTQVGTPDPLSLMNLGLVPLGDTLMVGTGPGLKGGLVYGLGVYNVYDSNLFLTENNPEGELSTSLAPWITYITDPEGGARFSLSANYRPMIRNYLNNPDLNGVDQSADFSINIEGSKSFITAYSRWSEISGTDRLTGQFVTGSLLNSGMAASYQIAPRTSLNGSWSASLSDYGTSSLVGAAIYTGQLGGYWTATERFSYGPAIRYTVSTSDNTGTRDVWALLTQAKYNVGERIQIYGALGFDYAQSSRDDESSTLGLTGNLTAYYVISELWGWRNTIQYVTVPSPTDTNYVVNNLLISTGVDRNLLRATVSGGLDLNFSSYEGVGAVTTQPEKESNVSTYVSYRRKLFSERVNFDSKIRYSMNSGLVDWNQFQLSAGLEAQF